MPVSSTGIIVDGSSSPSTCRHQVLQRQCSADTSACVAGERATCWIARVFQQVRRRHRTAGTLWVNVCHVVDERAAMVFQAEALC
jgi:hypothetical protein